MKWLSLKEHKPPVNIPLFVVRCAGDGDMFVAFFNEKEEWDCMDHYLLNDITHFCIPDPIEIEE